MGVHHSQLSASSLTSPFSSRRAAAADCRVLLLKAAWGGLPPFGSLGTQNNDMFFTFVNGNRSKDTVLLTAPGEMMPQ